MRALLIASVFGVVLAAGCGGDNEAASSGSKTSTSTTTTTGASACPDGTKRLRVEDVLTVPSSHELAEPTEKLEAFVRQYEKLLGGRVVDTDTAVDAAKTADAGTGVTVLNTTERAESDDLLRGAEEAEDEGRPSDRIEIAGEPGVIARTPDGAYTAQGKVGDRALVLLVADTKELVQSTARRVRAG